MSGCCCRWRAQDSPSICSPFMMLSEVLRAELSLSKLLTGDSNTEHLELKAQAHPVPGRKRKLLRSDLPRFLCPTSLQPVRFLRYLLFAKTHQTPHVPRHTLTACGVQAKPFEVVWKCIVIRGTESQFGSIETKMNGNIYCLLAQKQREEWKGLREFFFFPTKKLELIFITLLFCSLTPWNANHKNMIVWHGINIDLRLERDPAAQ